MAIMSPREPLSPSFELFVTDIVGVGPVDGGTPSRAAGGVMSQSIPPEVIKSDPATCRHVVMDELVGARWGFEDCITCGKRFPMRDDIDDGWIEP